jgi:diguanylate cyclase (GGDEF)-like protein
MMNKRITTRMVGWIIGGTLLAFAIFNMANYYLAFEVYYERLSRDNQIHTQNVARSVSSFYETVYRVVGEMAQAQEVKSMDPAQQQAFLRERFSQHGFFDNLVIQRVPDGVQTARVRGVPVPRPDRWWFRRILSDQRPFVSSAFFSFGFDSNTPTAVTGVFFPVMQGERMDSTLAAFLRLDEVQERVGRHYLNDDRYTYILDDAGNVIVHPEWEKTRVQHNYKTGQRAIVSRDEQGNYLLEGADYRLTYEKFPLAPGLQQVVKQVLAGESGTVEYTDLAGKVMLCSFTPVKISGYGPSWVAITVQDKTVAMAPLQEAAERRAVLSFLVLAGLAGIILWQSRELVKGSQQLQQSNISLEMANQELTALNEEMLAVTDELQSTNHQILQEVEERQAAEMKLRLRERQYRAIVRLIADNSAEFDMQMQSMLDSALELVEASDGFIALVENGRTMIRYARGNHEVLLDKDLTVEGGLLQLVLSSGVLQYVEDYQNCPERRQGSLWDTQRTAVVFPLKRANQVVGALSIAWKDDIRKLLADEIAMLQQFADMASLALQGAKLRDELSHIAYHDPLTGFPNRASLTEQLNRELAAVTQGSAGGVIFYIDLDELKGINDNFGHFAGDRLLVSVGEAIRKIVGETVFVARLGGDEFVIVWTTRLTTDEISRLADRLVAGLCQDYMFGNESARVSASMGIVIFPRDGDTGEELMTKADNAMYAAKAAGRNCWRFFEPAMLRDAQEKMALTNSLRRALERQELSVLYQPQMDLHSGRVIGFEALLRWHSKEHGQISPVRFIPLAEQSQLIFPIGLWVLQQACDFISRLAQAGYPQIRVAVNLSPKQLASETLTGSIGALLVTSAIDPKQLELEITESALLASLEESSRKLHQLAALGVRLALDDFGTGYSSLTHLRLFPVETLKIDKAFIDGIPKQEAVLVRSLIRFAQSLDMRVVAEGVERSEQWEFLQDCGCDIVQGYLMSRPISETEAFHFLRQKNESYTARE